MTPLTSIRVQSETASFAQAPARCEPRREARAKKAERVSYESGRALDANHAGAFLRLILPVCASPLADTARSPHEKNTMAVLTTPMPSCLRAIRVQSETAGFPQASATRGLR